MSTSKKRRTHAQSSRPTCDVFISYRRDGGDMAAMYFYRALKDRGYRVFYDLEVLRSGKFDDALLRSIHACTDFVLILSPHALDRCIDPNDWVRAEIAEALRLGKNIIPIMLKDFTFPDYLPEDIDDVRYQNGLTSTPEYFNESISRVCSRYLLSKPVERKKKPSPVAPVLLSLTAVLLLAAAIIYWFMSNADPAVPPVKSPAPAELPQETIQALSTETTAYETPLPTEYTYQYFTPVPEIALIPEITPVPQAVNPPRTDDNYYPDIPDEYDGLYAEPAAIIETPIPLYIAPAPQQNVPQSYTEPPVITQEPRPIVTPLPLVTPVPQQEDPWYSQEIPQDLPQGIQEEAPAIPQVNVPENEQGSITQTEQPITGSGPADIPEIPEQPQPDQASVPEVLPTETPVLTVAPESGNTPAS